MSYPSVRMRRLRRTPSMRYLMNKVKLSPSDLIYPIFVDENAKSCVPIASMPSCFRFPLPQISNIVKQVMAEQVKAIMLFGIPATKDELGSGAFSSDGIVQKAIKAVKSEFGDEIVVITDVCLCEYTSHGHCGRISNGQLENDTTGEILGKVAVSHAEAGADMVAPSAMIDGQVEFIREALDDAGFEQAAIMAYSAKFASNFYGPFREAADSTPKHGNRKGYQMVYGNPDEAMREIELDVKEGADVVMIKPALAYLDIIHRAKSKFNVPIAAYSVSGEYSLVKAAAQNGWIDEKAIALEILTAIKRAGADLIVTYFAKDVKKWLNQE